MSALMEFPRNIASPTDPEAKSAHNDIVFIYGALRSGTTVFRLMLDAHPRIVNPGEMDFLFDHLQPDHTHPTGWRYDLDALRMDRIFRASRLKIEGNLSGLDLLRSFFEQLKARAPWQVVSINLHRNIARVWDILPHARVLHMIRDPRDVARSSVQMGWAGTLYHGVAHWIDTEQAWTHSTADSARSDQTLEISYETLIEETETTLKAACAFLGVPFDPDMLSYHEKTTYGRPDVSLIQQWQRKCHGSELEEVEARAEHLMRARGYDLSHPRVPLSLMRRLGLSLRNKVRVYTFGMARFGVFTFLAEKLTRWVGLRAAHQTLTLRMQGVITQSLK